MYLSQFGVWLFDNRCTLILWALRMKLVSGGPSTKFAFNMLLLHRCGSCSPRKQQHACDLQRCVDKGASHTRQFSSSLSHHHTVRHTLAFQNALIAHCKAGRGVCVCVRARVCVCVETNQVLVGPGTGSQQEKQKCNNTQLFCKDVQM